MSHRFAKCISAILMLALVACSRQGVAKYKHVLTLEDGFGDPISLNPYIDSTWPTGIVTAELALAFFVRYDPSGSLKPDLITSIPTRLNGGVSNKGLTITYRLRPNLRWSDGIPLTSADVAFTTKVIADGRNNITAGGFANVTDVETPDPRTVVFQLKRPFANYATTFFATQGSDGANCILPKHSFSGTFILQSRFNEQPIGAGPFRVTGWRRGTSVTFEANPYYWGNVPKLRRIVYRVRSTIRSAQLDYLSGETQLWERIPELQIDSARPRGQVILTNPDAYLHLDFNVRRAAVAGEDIRRAVLLAIDRARIVTTASRGYGRLQEGVVREAAPIGVRLPFEAYDPKRARTILAGRRPTLQLVFPAGDPMLDTMVEMIRSDLQAVGVILQTRQYDPSLYYAKILSSDTWDISLFNWTTDATGTLQPLFDCQNGLPVPGNDMRYCNRQLNRMLTEFTATYDAAKRRGNLVASEKIIARDVPTIVLFFRRFGYAVAAGVSKFNPPMDTPFDGFENVDNQ